jgi:hypothetical protein
MAGSLRFALLMLLTGLFTARPALANEDRVSIAHDITVTDGTTMGDVVCLLCNVRVHGVVQGDVVAVLGSVTVDSERSISGDLVTVGGDVSLGGDASVHGDVAVVAGDLETAPGASVGGDRSVIGGRGWLLFAFAPLLIFAGIIWLIVWLVRRSRYRFPMYPQGRGF